MKKQVIVRPTHGLGIMKAVFVFGFLVFLLLPVLIAVAAPGNTVAIVLDSVLALAALVGWTYYGRIALDMRVEVDPDEVRIYWFLPRPTVLRRSAIADAEPGWQDMSSWFPVHLALVDGGHQAVAPLTARNAMQGTEYVAKLRAALRDVAPAEGRGSGF